MKVEWCPTEDMTVDFWTKPLQGALFRRFRDLIMGVIPQPKPRGEKPTKTSLKDPNTDGKKTKSSVRRSVLENSNKSPKGAQRLKDRSWARESKPASIQDDSSQRLQQLHGAAAS